MNLYEGRLQPRKPVEAPTPLESLEKRVAAFLEGLAGLPVNKTEYMNHGGWVSVDAVRELTKIFSQST